MTSLDVRSCTTLVAAALLATACASRSATDATSTGEIDTDLDPATPDACVRDDLGMVTRRGCVDGLAARCEDATSEPACVGQWSAADIDVLGPLEVTCRWHPEAVLVQAVADECEVIERASMCLGVVLTNDPDDPVGDPRCDPFGELTCDGDVQSGRPHARRVSNTDTWLVKPVECGAILGFETDVDRCWGDHAATACGCFCE